MSSIRLSSRHHLNSSHVLCLLCKVLNREMTLKLARSYEGLTVPKERYISSYCRGRELVMAKSAWVKQDLGGLEDDKEETPVSEKKIISTHTTN